MDTIYDRAARHALENITGSEYESVRDTLRNLRSGFYSAEEIDAIFQADSRSRIGLETAWAVMHMRDAIFAGEVLRAAFNIGIAPSADRSLNMVRDELERTLREFIDVDMSPTLGAEAEGADGWIRFKEPLKLIRTTLGKGNREIVETVETTIDQQVPLEIGTTSAPKTFSQMQRFGALARWPYNSRRVFLFFAPEPL